MNSRHPQAFKKRSCSMRRQKLDEQWEGTLLVVGSGFTCFNGVTGPGFLVGLGEDTSAAVGVGFVALGEDALTAFRLGGVGGGLGEDSSSVLRELKFGLSVPTLSSRSLSC